MGSFGSLHFNHLCEHLTVLQREIFNKEQCFYDCNNNKTVVEFEVLCVQLDLFTSLMSHSYVRETCHVQLGKNH